MAELKRYTIICEFEGENLKFGRYYAKSKTKVARRAFKYLCRIFNCSQITFDIQETSSKKTYKFLGTKIQKQKPLAKLVSDNKYIIIKHDYFVNRIRD
jgi:hypothetical protein